METKLSPVFERQDAETWESYRRMLLVHRANDFNGKLVSMLVNGRLNGRCYFPRSRDSRMIIIIPNEQALNDIHFRRRRKSFGYRTLQLPPVTSRVKSRKCYQEERQAICGLARLIV